MKQVQLPSVFNHYYKFCRLVTKAKSRMDCTNSTKSYPTFETKRATKPVKESVRFDATNVGDLVIYWGIPDKHIKAHNKRQADRSITLKGENLTSVYIYDEFEDDTKLAFGDIKGTSDGVIMLYNIEEVNGVIQDGCWLEMFIACGKSNEVRAICQQIQDGDLDEEIKRLREGLFGTDAKGNPDAKVK